jgi:hypothetical protein
VVHGFQPDLPSPILLESPDFDIEKLYEDLDVKGAEIIDFFVSTHRKTEQ